MPTEKEACERLSAELHMLDSLAALAEGTAKIKKAMFTVEYVRRLVTASSARTEGK